MLFGAVILPLGLIVGMAVDFSFYIQAQAQLNLAADAAAMHAVRAASMAAALGTTDQTAGRLAGQEWFAAQAEVVPGVTLTGSGAPLPVSVVITTTPTAYTATVGYAGTLNTILGRLLGVTAWPVAGSATSTIARNVTLHPVARVVN